MSNRALFTSSLFAGALGVSLVLQAWQSLKAASGLSATTSTTVLPPAPVEERKLPLVKDEERKQEAVQERTARSRSSESTGSSFAEGAKKKKRRTEQPVAEAEKEEEPKEPFVVAEPQEVERVPAEVEEKAGEEEEEDMLEGEDYRAYYKRLKREEIEKRNEALPRWKKGYRGDGSEPSRQLFLHKQAYAERKERKERERRKKSSNAPEMSIEPA